MKRMKITTVTMVFALAVLVLAACQKSEFGGDVNSEKLINIHASNAHANEYFITGSLEAEEGDTIKMTADLSKGSIKVEIIGAPADQSADELPEMDGEPILSADLKTNEGASGTVPAGTYMLKATCIEKATGTIQVEVISAQ